MNRNAIGMTLGSLLLATVLMSGCLDNRRDSLNIRESLPPEVIQLAPEAVRNIGFQTVTVQARQAGSELVSTGTIRADENRIFHINSFVSGRVVRDNVLLGDTVRAGQTLAVVQNLEVAKLQASYIHELHQNEIEVAQARAREELARKNMAREQRLLADGISPGKDYQQAVTDEALARTDLEGKTEHSIHIRAEGRAMLSAFNMAPGNVHSERIRTGSPITTPRAGIVTRKSVTLGDMVTPDIRLYEVTDLSRLWLDVAIYPKDLPAVRLGEGLIFTTDSFPGASFAGMVNYIQPNTVDGSQTYLARAYLRNPGGRLRPGMFGQVRIQQAVAQSKPFVPEAAIQQYGREFFVFEPLSQNRFRKRTIVPGAHVGGGYLVESGLRAGETVIGQGSFTLKAEMLKNQTAQDDDE